MAETQSPEAVIHRLEAQLAQAHADYLRADSTLREAARLRTRARETAVALQNTLEGLRAGISLTKAQAATADK